jgi:hypothetical protein
MNLKNHTYLMGKKATAQKEAPRTDQLAGWHLYK